MKAPINSLSRRQFVRQSGCAALGLTGMINTLAHLKLMNAALAQSAAPLPGYKALVVLFLFGGNDSNNTLIPQINHPEYTNYKTGRQKLTIFDPGDGTPTDPKSIPLSANGDYGVHPSMQAVADLFKTNGSGGDPDLAFVANVGTLAYPILDRLDYINGTVPVPPQLFSHSDQQLQWQSSLPDRPFTTGWGGRIADLLASRGTTGPVSFSISLSGINSLQVGNDTVQYSVSPTGAISLTGYGTNYSSAIDANGYRLTRVDGQRLKGFEDIMRFTHTHLLEEGYDDVVRRARANEGLIGQVLTAATNTGYAFDTTFGTGTTGLIGQLKMIAKLIAGRDALGSSSGQRQIFFCSVGGYDTHASQLSAHDTLMDELSLSLGAFKQAMVGLGVHDDVLAITHSDFTRTLTPNSTDPTSAGSDHGWGGHHIVMGGAVKGGRIYGNFPSLLVNAGQDVDKNRGRWIPTTAVDQYAAVGARWLGLSDADLLTTIFPNLGRFPSIDDAVANLGFI